MGTARAQRLALDRRLDCRARRRLQPARLVDVARRHVGVRPGAPWAVAQSLAFARVGDLCCGRCRRFTRRKLEQLFPLDARDRALEVDAVDHRSAQPALVPVLRTRQARTALHFVPVVPAGARVRGRDQLEARRIRHGPARAHDADDSVFERLAQRLQRFTPELRELV